MNTHVSTRKPNFRNNSIIPSLENGDRLTREEFHRRYEAMPKNVRAELIKGIVYMASPVRADNHGKPHADMMSALSYYRLVTNGISLLDNATYVARDDYEPQPDIVLRIEGKHGGKSWINDSGYLEGSPELVVEISSTTVSYDLHEKLELYEAKAVQEYIVWRVLDEQIDWFSLEDGKYKKMSADENGIMASKIFPGLELNVNALLEDDMKKVLATLQSGLESEAYKEFSASLGIE